MTPERKLALELANGFDGTDTEIVDRAEKYLAFLNAGGEAQPETASPKPLRGRKSVKTDAPAQPGAPDPQPTGAATSPSDHPPAASAATEAPSAPAVAQVLDIFGAPSAPAASPTPPTASAETPKKPSSEKEPTLDEVRSALTDVQTKFESRPAAMTLLKKYAPNTVTTGELKKEDYAKLIKDCKDAVASGKSPV